MSIFIFKLGTINLVIKFWFSGLISMIPVTDKDWIALPDSCWQSWAMSSYCTVFKFMCFDWFM